MSKEKEYYQKIIQANKPIFISKKKVVEFLEDKKSQDKKSQEKKTKKSK